MPLYSLAKKFQIKLGFYREKIDRIKSVPDFRRGQIVMDWETYDKKKEISLFEIIDYSKEEFGWMYECKSSNKRIKNITLDGRFPEDFPWAEQESKNQFFYEDSLLSIISYKQLIHLYRSVINN